jgi:predicted enzyme related to lactoylglutathione lyase
VVGFLLDAKIRRATDNEKSLDDVMRLAYRRYAGERGYTEQEFLDTAAEVADIDLKEFFDKALFSTDELNYDEALDWFGLRFAPSEDGQPTWRLEANPDATEEQQARFAAWLAPSDTQIAEAAVVIPVSQPLPSGTAQGGTAPAGSAAPQGGAPAAAPGVGAANAAPLIDGLGGVFIFSANPGRLADWYEKNLGLQGIRSEQDGAFTYGFKFAQTVWAILPSRDDRQDGPSQFQINYRVKDMDRMLAHLRAQGVTIEKSEDYPYGRFTWVIDPDGNRVELFQEVAPPAGGTAPAQPGAGPRENQPPAEGERGNGAPQNRGRVDANEAAAAR